MAWYLAPSLAKLRAEVDARWPRRGRESDGTIGDEEHASRDSDHNPNSRESVNAWDMDKDGVNVDQVIAAFQRHPSAHYWIWQGQIADRDDGWRRRLYGGSNPHTAHAHFSIRQTATAEQDTRPWGLEEDVNEQQNAHLVALAYRSDAVFKLKTPINNNVNNTAEDLPIVTLLKDVQTKTASIDAKLVALATAVAGVDEATAAAVKARFDAIDAANIADVGRDAELRTLLEQHSDGTLTAEAVVQRMGDLLSGQA